MEFTNEIFFDKNLIENETIIITYCGKLYREHSSEIYIVYGFGGNWEHTESVQMKEKENGFEATITLRSYNTFNFCFKNNYNIWDNNSGFNYIAPISQKPEQNNNSIIDSQIIKENTNDVSSNNDSSSTIEENTNDVQEETTSEKNNETSVQEDSTSSDTTTNNFEVQSSNKDNDIEAVFSSLLDSILDMKSADKNESININDLSGFGLQSVDEIKEEDFVNCDEIFKDFYDELATVPVNNETQNFETSEEDLDNLFVSLFQEKNKDEDLQRAQTENLDYLMDNILNSIVTPENSNDIELTSPIEKITTTAVSEKSDFPAVKDEGLYEKIVDASYNLFKIVGTACKKIGSLIKLKAKEFGLIKEK